MCGKHWMYCDADELEEELERDLEDESENVYNLLEDDIHDRLPFELDDELYE